MTLHRVKLMELSCIAMVGLGEHAKLVGAADDADGLMSWSLVYVAATRARDESAGGIRAGCSGPLRTIDFRSLYFAASDDALAGAARCYTKPQVR